MTIPTQDTDPLAARVRMLVAFVDVDDTLVRSFGSKRIPMSLVIERVRELHAHGAHSTAGAAVAPTTRAQARSS